MDWGRKQIQSTIKPVVSFPFFFFPLWLLNLNSKQFKGQNCTTRKRERTATEMICLGIRNRTEDPHGLEEWGKFPRFVVLGYFIVISIPGKAEAAAVMMAAEPVGQTPNSQSGELRF